MAPLALWGPIPETEWHLNRGISLSQIIGHRLGATLAVDRGGDDATRITGTLAAGEQALDRHMLIVLSTPIIVAPFVRNPLESFPKRRNPSRSRDVTNSGIQKWSGEASKPGV